MTSMSAGEARANLYALIEQVDDDAVGVHEVGDRVAHLVAQALGELVVLVLVLARVAHVSSFRPAMPAAMSSVTIATAVRMRIYDPDAR